MTICVGRGRDFPASANSGSNSGKTKTRMTMIEAPAVRSSKLGYTSAEAQVFREQSAQAPCPALGSAEREKPPRAQLAHDLIARRCVEHAAHHSARPRHCPILKLRHLRPPAPRAALRRSWLRLRLPF